MKKMKKVLIAIFLIQFIVSGAYSQAPTNDECANATEVFPNNSCTPIMGTILNATISSSIPSNFSKDVWFKFTAQSTTQYINVSGAINYGIIPVFYVYSSCSSTTPLITSSTQTARSKDLAVTGLTIGATYYYRVVQRNESYAGITNFNIYTCVATAENNGDANDLCSGAIPLTVDSKCNLRTFSNVNATTTTPKSKPSCDMYDNATNDMWYTAEVPANGILSVIAGFGSMGQGGMTWYRGSCASLTEMACESTTSTGSDPKFSIEKSGLTPGDIIYIRIWTQGLSGQGVTVQGTYSICASTPPECGLENPKAADLCANATPICNLNGYCGSTSSDYTADNTGTPPPSSGFEPSISVENNSWLSFNANATSASFTVYVSNCTIGTDALHNGIQIGIYDKNCVSFSPKVTWNPGAVRNTVLTVNHLVIGNDYLIMIDGAAGAQCDYLITTNSGVNTLDAGNDTTICSGGPLTLSANGPVGSIYTWTKRTSTGVSSVGTGAIINISPGPTDSTTTYIVTVSGGGLCSGLVDSMVVSVRDCNQFCPTVSVNDTTICPSTGGIATIKATPSPASNYTYVWSVPSGFPNPGNVASFNTNVGGTYTVSISTTKYLCNTDFDDNQIVTSQGWVVASSSDVPCWKSGTGFLELWKYSVSNPYNGGVYAYSGTQFAELNASSPTTLYQDFTVVPGSAASISFAHRGRNGIDVMEIQIGPVGGPYVSLGQFSDGKTAWNYRTLSYTFPSNTNTNYRILFSAVSTSNNNLSEGNFLDAISVNLTDCSPSASGIVTLNNGCTAANPCPTVLVNDTTICSTSGGIATITATPSIAANYTYTWTVPAGATNPGNNPSFTTTVAGTYTVTLASTNYLCNTDFDDNQIVTSQGWLVTPVSNVPCWKSGDGSIELWKYSASNPYNGGVYAYSGTQFAELNASNPTNLYQDFTIIPGSTASISFAHRGRNGTDVMEIQIGPVGGPYVSIGQFSDGKAAWGFHSVNYTFPISSNTTYRISFSAISTSNGNLSEGNFLDAISINLNTCTPTDAGVVTSSCGCTPPNSNAGADATITCTSNTSGVSIGKPTVAGENYSWSPTTGLSSSTVSNPTANPTVTTTYTVTTTSSDTCFSTDQVVITVDKTAPVANAGADDTITCTANTSGVIIGVASVAGNTYSWTPTTGLSSSTAANPTADPTTTTTYALTTTTTANGCSANDEVVVTVDKIIPTANISYTASPYCSSLTSPQAVTLVGTSGGTYSSTAGLTLNANTGEITPSSSIAGTSYVVTYSVGPTGECPAVSDTANVFIDAAPSATISYAASPYCSSLSTPQVVTFAGSTGGTYSVLPSGLSLDALSGAITPSTSTAGVYVVTYITPTSGACPAVSDTANVTITAIPTAAISYAASPYCTSLNSPQAITFTGTTGGTYAALPTGLSMNASGSITPSTSTAGVYVVTYSIAAAGGCPLVSDTANVTITAAPTAKISYSSAIFCTALATAQPVTLTGTNAYTGGSYSSLPSGLSMDGAGAITPSASTPQLYTITYSYPASGGCAAGTADTTVTIAAIPTADIIYSGSPFCTTLTSPQSVTFTGTTGGLYSTTGGLTLNPTDGAITPSTSTAGTYVVTYAILAGGGCPAVSDTANVTINGKPTIVITGVNSICTGESATLKASGATSYVWDNTLTTDSITVTPIQNTTYKVTGTALGCSDTASYAVAIKPLPTLSIQGAELLCIGDSTQLTASGADSYLWSPQASLSSSSLATVKAFPQTPTTYTLVGTLNGCIDSITHTISVYALPIISLSSPTSGCEPLRVDFTASSTPQMQSISWNFGNGSSSTSTSPNALYLNDGVYDVSANVTDVNGCKNDTTEVGFVRVFPKPVVDFTYTPSQGMVNEPVTFTSSYTQTPATWMWQFGDGNTQSNPVSVATYSYVVSKTYTVTHIVQTDQGCKDTAFRQIVVLTRITIPNVLTPNNDGFNDTFIIDGLQYVDGCHLKIYNRWGRKVYESESYKSDWDGGTCSEGVYFYVLTVPTFLGAGPFSGSLTLFRE